MERECNKCIHHTSGMCDSWECKMQTVEDVKREAVKGFKETVVAELEAFARENDREPNAGFIDMCIEIVRGKE